MVHARRLPDPGDQTKAGPGVLEAEIERARYLLDLPDDWDMDGSPGFAQTTWERTVGLAVDLCTRLAEGWLMTPRDVEIMPGANGNLSLEVAYPDATLLFSISPDGDVPVRYYGWKAVAGRSAH